MYHVSPWKPSICNIVRTLQYHHLQPYVVCSWPLFREFAKEKDRVESRAGFLLLKEEQKLEREMNGYMNWICKAGKSILGLDWIEARLKGFLLLHKEQGF